MGPAESKPHTELEMPSLPWDLPLRIPALGSSWQARCAKVTAAQAQRIPCLSFAQIFITRSHPAKQQHHNKCANMASFRPQNIKSLKMQPLTKHRFTLGRQTSHPTRARAAAGQVHRHRAPRHDELGVEDKHQPRHLLQHRRPPTPPVIYCAGIE